MHTVDLKRFDSPDETRNFEEGIWQNPSAGR
jgi:hypothetical protein